MPHPLAKIKGFNYAALDKELKPRKHEIKPMGELLKAYEGDYWQEGQGSLFPLAVGGNSSDITGAIAKRFVYRNVIAECVARVSGSFFGRAPDWAFSKDDKPLERTPPDSGEANPQPDDAESQSETDEIEKALGRWWAEQKAAEVLGEAVESRLVAGRGAVRVYVPDKYRKEANAEEFEPLSSMSEAIDAIRVEFVKPTQSRLLTDGGELFGMVRYEVREDWETEELTKVIEFSFVDDDGSTFSGMVKETGEKTVEGKDGTGATSVPLSDPLELGGRTLLLEIAGKPYVTDALYKANQLVNLNLTCAGFSAVDNGFGEVFLTNVALETKKVPAQDGVGTDGNGFNEVPVALKRGGGAVQSLVGIQTMDEAGNETLGTPGVHFRDPSPMTAFKDGAQMGYVACLQEAGQMHALISGDAAASGESRVQALTDFWLRVRPYKPEVDTLGGSVLSAVILLAAELCKQADKFKGLGVAYNSKIFIGALSSEEKTFTLSAWKDGAISLETARGLIGVEDPVLEHERVQGESKGDLFTSNQTVFQAKADLALQLTGMLPDAYLLKFLGIKDDKEVEKILQILADETAAKNAAAFGLEPEVDPNADPNEDLNPEEPV